MYLSSRFFEVSVIHLRNQFRLVFGESPSEVFFLFFFCGYRTTFLTKEKVHREVKDYSIASTNRLPFILSVETFIHARIGMSQNSSMSFGVCRFPSYTQYRCVPQVTETPILPFYPSHIYPSICPTGVVTHPCRLDGHDQHTQDQVLLDAQRSLAPQQLH